MRKSRDVVDPRKTHLSAAKAWKVNLRGTSLVRERMSQQQGVEIHPSRPGVVWIRLSQQPWCGESHFVVQAQYQKACLRSPGLEIDLLFQPGAESRRL